MRNGNDVVVFENLFTKSERQPINYKGKVVQHHDNFLLKSSKQKLIITIEKTTSTHIQAINLTSDSGFIVDKVKIKKSIILREDTIPSKEVTITVLSKDKNLSVRNVSFWKNWADHEIRSDGNGTAMITEELPNEKGKRYFCNDVDPDDDFDDLIFRIEYVD